MRSHGRLGWSLLGVVVVVETVLVVGAFNPAPHTGGDNAGYVSLAHALVTTGSYTETFDPARPPHTKYPPVFPAVLAALIALGARTWVALKATAALSTVAAAAFAYLWAVGRVGPWPALAVGLLFGASSAVIYYSHWVLSDPLFVALTLAALWALDRKERHGAWLAFGVVAAGLAYLTRSAGLPLLVALLGWLAWERRWRSAAVAAVALAVPGLAWWLRGRGAPGSYATEFWMVDPYQPALGTVGPLGLVPRALENLSGYVLGHGPAGIVGARGPWVSLLGVALVALALYGWVRSVRARVGPAELLLPLYAGLVLLWPTVWSGDRFALPLYPLVFLYGVVAIGELHGRMAPLASSLATAAALLVLALPIGASWVRESSLSRACAQAVAEGGPFACYGPGVGAFVSAAEWAAGALPEDAAVLSRKPRIFYALSGVPSRTFPFDADPAVLLAAAADAGARYVLVDEWDGLAGAYVGGAVTQRPDAFCFVQAFGQPGAGGAQLLGILDVPGGGDVETGGRVRIALCPPGYAAGGPAPHSSSSSAKIPLLEGLDP